MNVFDEIDADQAPKKNVFDEIDEDQLGNSLQPISGSIGLPGYPNLQDLGGISPTRPASPSIGLPGYPNLGPLNSLSEDDPIPSESIGSVLKREGKALLRSPISFERGLATKFGDVAQGAARAGDILSEGDLLSGSSTPNLTIGQRRLAYEQAMKDPRYQDRLIQAGEDPQRLRQVEGTFGPTAKLDIIQTPEKERAKIAANESAARQYRLENESALNQWGKDQSYFARKVFNGTPDTDETFTTMLAESAGAMGPDIALGMIPYVGPSLSVGSYGLQSGAQQAQEAVDAGKPESADIAFVSAAGLGALSEHILGVAPQFWKSVKAFRRAGANPSKLTTVWERWAAANPVKSTMLISGPKEMVQESSEQVGQNLIASDLAGYDPERKATKDVVKSGAAGLILGTLVGGAGRGVAQKMDANQQQAIDNKIAQESGRMAALQASMPNGYIPTISPNASTQSGQNLVGPKRKSDQLLTRDQLLNSTEGRIADLDREVNGEIVFDKDGKPSRFKNTIAKTGSKEELEKLQKLKDSGDFDGIAKMYRVSIVGEKGQVTPQEEAFNKNSDLAAAAAAAQSAQPSVPKQAAPEAMDFARSIVEMPAEEFRAKGQSFNKQNVDLGLNASDEQLAELIQLRDKSQARADATMATNPQTAEEMNLAATQNMMPQFYNEAINIAQTIRDQNMDFDNRVPDLSGKKRDLLQFTLKDDQGNRQTAFTISQNEMMDIKALENKAKAVRASFNKGGDASFSFGEKKSDYDKYNELVAQMGKATLEEKFSGVIQRQIEEIKNRHGGMPPAAPSVALEIPSDVKADILSEYNSRIKRGMSHVNALNAALSEVEFNNPNSPELFNSVKGVGIDSNRLAKELAESDFAKGRWSKSNQGDAYFTPGRESFFNGTGTTWNDDGQVDVGNVNAASLKNIASKDSARVIETMGEDAGLKWLSEVSKYKPSSREANPDVLKSIPEISGENTSFSMSGKNERTEVPFLLAPDEISQVDDKHDASRVGTAKQGKVNATTQDTNVSYETVTPDNLKKQMDRLTQFAAGVPLPKWITKFTDPRARAEAFINWQVRNLVALYNKFTPYVNRATHWYDGARRIADQISADHNVSPEQAAAVLAAFSPMKDWFQNVAMGQRFIAVFAKGWNTKISGEHSKTMDEIVESSAANLKPKQAKAAKRDRRIVLNKTIGFTPAELWNRGGLKNQILSTWAMRTIAQNAFPSSYDIVTPEGGSAGISKKKNGRPKKLVWQSSSAFRSAISIMLDGSLENISEQLSEKHKTRAFYNNIIAPNNRFGDTTIDTHAVNAAVLYPMGQKQTLVADNFGKAGVAGKGNIGTYWIYDEALKRAAKQLGLQPRQLQSITWEAVRGLFTDSLKRDKVFVKKINDIYANATDEQSARDQILKLNIEPPEWAGSDVGGSGGTSENTSSLQGDSGKSKSDSGRTTRSGDGLRSGKESLKLSSEESASRPESWAEPEPTTKESITNRAKELASEFPGAAPVVIVSSYHELPDELHALAYAQGGSPALIDGVLHKGTVYIVANKMNTMADVEATWLHEQAGHFATDSKLGPKLDRFMQQVHDSFTDHPLMQKMREDYKRGTEIRHAREFIANISENLAEQPNAWKKIVAIFRQFLRDIGFVKTVSENDIRVLIDSAMSKLSSEDPTVSGNDFNPELQGVSFSFSEGPGLNEDPIEQERKATQGRFFTGDYTTTDRVQQKQDARDFIAGSSDAEVVDLIAQFASGKAVQGLSQQNVSATIAEVMKRMFNKISTSKNPIEVAEAWKLMDRAKSLAQQEGSVVAQTLEARKVFGEELGFMAPVLAFRGLAQKAWSKALGLSKGQSAEEVVSGTTKKATQEAGEEVQDEIEEGEAQGAAQRIVNQLAKSQSDTLSWPKKSDASVKEVVKWYVLGDITDSEFTGTMNMLGINPATTDILLSVSQRERAIRETWEKSKPQGAQDRKKNQAEMRNLRAQAMIALRLGATAEGQVDAVINEFAKSQSDTPPSERAKQANGVKEAVKGMLNGDIQEAEFDATLQNIGIAATKRSILKTIIRREIEIRKQWDIQKEKEAQAKKSNQLEMRNLMANAVNALRIGVTAENQVDSVINEFAKSQSDTPPVERAKQTNGVREAVKGMINGDIQQAEFDATLENIGISATKRSILTSIVNREIQIRKQIENQRQSEAADALVNNSNKIQSILNKVAKEGGINWSELFLNETRATQKERKDYLLDQIRNHPKLQGLTPAQALMLENELTKSWEANRLKVFKSEFSKRIKLPTVEAGTKLINKALPELIRQANLGTLDDAAFLNAFAKELGLPSLTGDAATKLTKLAQEAQDKPEGILRNKILQQMIDVIQKTTPAHPLDIARDYWYNNALSGTRTLTSILTGSWIHGAVMAAQQAMDAAILKGRPGVAGRILQAFLTDSLEGVANGWDVFKTGDYTRRAEFSGNINRLLSGQGKLDSLEGWLKHGNMWQKALGLTSYVRRAVVGLDYVGAIGTRGSGVIYNAMLDNPEQLRAALDRFNKEKSSQAKKQAQAELGPDAKWVDVRARQLEILESGIDQQLKDNATVLGEVAALNAHPVGWGGIVYRLLEALPRAIESSTGASKPAAAFAAFAGKAAAGLAFARAAINMTQTASNWMPIIGGVNYARASLGKKLPEGHWARVMGIMDNEGKPITDDRRRMIAAAQVSGLALAAIAYAMTRGGDDEDKEKFDISGSWYGLTPQQKKDKMATGERPLSIRVKGRWIAYGNLPMGGALAMVGNMRDKERADKKKMSTDDALTRITDAWASGLFFIKDLSVINSLSRTLGIAAMNTDESATVLNRFVAQQAGNVSGVIPFNSAVREIDTFFDPNVYKPTSGLDYWVRGIPFVRRTVGEGVEYNMAGLPVENKLTPQSRLVAPSVKKDPVVEVLSRLISMGVFPHHPDPSPTWIKNGQQLSANDLPKESYEYQTKVLKQWRETMLLDAEYLKTITPEEYKSYFNKTLAPIRDEVKMDIQDRIDPEALDRKGKVKKEYRK